VLRTEYPKSTLLARFFLFLPPSKSASTCSSGTAWTSDSCAMLQNKSDLPTLPVLVSCQFFLLATIAFQYMCAVSNLLRCLVFLFLRSILFAFDTTHFPAPTYAFMGVLPWISRLTIWFLGLY
jgi:hypothetical protein